MTTYTLDGFSATAPIQLNTNTLAASNVSLVLPDDLDRFTWSPGGTDETGLTYALVDEFNDAYGSTIDGVTVNFATLDAYVLQVDHVFGTTFVLSLFNSVTNTSHLFALGGFAITSPLEIAAIFANPYTITPAPVGSGFGPGETILLDDLLNIQITENDNIVGTPQNDLYLSGVGFDTVDGGGGNDTLNGGTGADRLIGGVGNDRLDGGVGDDTMSGGLGNDRYVIDSIGDFITGEIGFSLGGGIDTVESWIDFTLPRNVEILRMQGSADLNGTGGFAPEALVGQTGNNVLNGGGGNDVITAKAGNDTLIGGLGADSLVGDEGADVFDFNATSESRPGQANRDFINGFVRGEDRIDLSDIDADLFSFGDQAFVFIGDDAFSNTAGELRFFTFGGGNFNIVEADVNGDGAADMQIFVNLTNFMTGTDFVL